MATHSSILAWRIPGMGEPGGLQFMGSLESDTTERLHFHFSVSCIGEGNGNPLQCSSLENPRDVGAWWAAVYGVAQSRTRLKRLSSSSSIPTYILYQWVSKCFQQIFKITLMEVRKSYPFARLEISLCNGFTLVSSMQTVTEVAEFMQHELAEGGLIIKLPILNKYCCAVTFLPLELLTNMQRVRIPVYPPNIT